MAARKWTPEQKQQQAELIKIWSPWRHSTGPKTARGKLNASRNAFRGGIRLRLKELSKEINDLLREQAEFVRGL